MDESDELHDERPLSTGIPGLDDVLGGGFTPNRLYLVEGNPGSGKTTLALQCLLEGVRRGEKGPLRHPLRDQGRTAAVGRSRTAGRSTASTSSSWSPPEAETRAGQPARHVPAVRGRALGDTTKAILAEVERIRARRVVIDSLSEMRLLAQSPLRYRRQILALKQYFIGRECTVFLLDDLTAPRRGPAAPEHRPRGGQPGAARPEYGAERRRLRVVKLRGPEVPRRAPRLRHPAGRPRRLPAARRRGARPGPDAGPAQVRQRRSWTPCWAGACSTGTSASCSGPAGSGKSTLAIQYARAAAGRGERAAVFAFDEGSDILQRDRGLGMDLEDHLDRASSPPAGRHGRAVAGGVRPPVRRAVEGATRAAGRRRSSSSTA